MTDEQFIVILKQHSDSVEKNMEQGFKVIAAEMREAITQRDSKLFEKIADIGSAIGKLEDAKQKHDREISLIFTKTDKLETGMSSIGAVCQSRLTELDRLRNKVDKMGDVEFDHQKSISMAWGSKMDFKTIIVPIIGALIGAAAVWLSK